MKLRRKVVSVVLAVICLLSCISAFPVAAAESKSSDEVRYTQKIVSVLYDNSGSMISENKNEYALYALQMLMALLDSEDVLVITPMNKNASPVSSTSAGIEIDLSRSDRNSEISKALTSSTSFLSKSPSGGTPATAIRVAVKQLEDRGLKTRDKLATAAENKEHWLVVVTDGAFNEQLQGYSADQLIESYITDYPSLRTIYLGLGSDSPDLSGSTLGSKLPFTPYRAATTDQIVESMQRVANQLSGRYNLDPKYYTVNGSTVTVDLNQCELSLKNISVIAQNCGVELISAKHDGKSVNIAAPCIIKPIGLEDKLKEGYSGVISGNPYLAGGKLTLEFSAPIEKSKLSILAEPALIIDSYIEYQGDSGWEKGTMQYINSNLTQNDKIRVGYDVYEQAKGSVVDLEKVFGKTETNVTYAGRSYKIGEEIPLVVGNNEIGISVSIMDGTYTMFSSIRCIIEQDPTSYRVEKSGDDEVSAAGKAQTHFTVYANNSPLSSAKLNSYKWKVSVTGPDGKEADYNASVGADGRITVTLNAKKRAYGDYKVDFTVTSEYGISRSETHTISYAPKTIEIKGNHIEAFPKGQTTAESDYTVYVDGIKLSAAEIDAYFWEAKTYAPNGKELNARTELTSDGKIKTYIDASSSGYGCYLTKVRFAVSESFGKEYTNEIKNYPTSVTISTDGAQGYSVSPYQMTVDYEPMTFKLFADGEPFVLNSSIVKYKLTVDGTDVTQYVQTEGNVLKYAPKVEHFGKVPAAGEKKVVISVECPEAMSLNASETVTMTVGETKYSVLAVDGTGKKVDRFGLSEADAALYFKVLRDGEPMSVTELEAAIASGEISITDKRGTFTWQLWLPVGRTITATTLDSEPVIEFRVTRDWIKPFDSFAAMMILNGEKSVSVSYMTAEATDSIVFSPSHWWSYVWRVLVILFTIHCILYIVGFFNGKCRYLPSGVFVSASLNNDRSNVSFTITEINLSFWEKYGWQIKRFIPHKRTLWYNQPPIENPTDSLSIGFFDSPSPSIRFDFDDTKKLRPPVMTTNAGRTFRAFLNSLSKYDGRGETPALTPAMTVAEFKTLVNFDSRYPTPLQSDKSHSITAYYGRERKEKLRYIVFFVKKSR